MKAKKTNKRCRRLRNWLYSTLSNHLGLNADWVQNHIASCPKCQRRLASLSKVYLAFSLIKSQPHSLDLLMRANSRAVSVLKHNLRYSQKAAKLKKVLPEPKFIEKFGKYRNSVVNTAACIAILFLLKVGVFSSMDNIQSKGQQALRQYYAVQIGDEMADEIFSA